MIGRIVLAAAGAAIVALALWHPAPQPALLGAGSAPAARVRSDARAARRSTADGRAVVYVAGSVAKPGLYRLAAGSRAADAVSAAGGMRQAADAAGVNLAEPVRDGDEIFVPAVGQAPRAHVRVRSRSNRRGRAPGPPALGLDVNTAAADELAAVPGIGAELAARIVALRQADGAFSTLDELLDVSGMTQSRLERARPYLLVR